MVVDESYSRRCGIETPSEPALLMAKHAYVPAFTFMSWQHRDGFLFLRPNLVRGEEVCRR